MDCFAGRRCRCARGATTTEVIILICLIAVFLLIFVTAFGRQIALLFRRDTRALGDGNVRKTMPADVTDLTHEFGPSFSDLAAGNSASPNRTGPMGTLLPSQVDFLANPARDPSSSTTLGNLIGGNPPNNPNGTQLRDFPGTLALPGNIDATTLALQQASIAPQVGNPAPVTREQGAIIVRLPDGSLVARPGNNPGNPGSWNPNFQNSAPGETVVGDIHVHPPTGHPNFSPEGFSDGDIFAGLIQQGPAAAATATQGTVRENLIIMRTGDEMYVAVRTANTNNAVTQAQLATAGQNAFNDAIAAGLSPREARFQANMAMAELAGLALYRGRAGETLQRVH